MWWLCAVIAATATAILATTGMTEANAAMVACIVAGTLLILLQPTNRTRPKPGSERIS